MKRSLEQSSVLFSFLLAASVLASRTSFAADDKPKDDQGTEAKPADEKPKDEPATKDAASDKPAEPATGDKPAAPASDTAAPTSATASVDTSAGATADLTAASTADTEEPSIDHPAFRAPGAKRCSATPLRQGDHPEYVDRSCYETRIGGKDLFFYGGLELDVGYAKYTYKDAPLQPHEDFTDMRGRFVVGPMLHHDFGDSGFWVAATGQLVAWVRDRAGNQYQINADDVYGQVGGRLGSGQWDFQVGRFMTWRVYHKGLGFDLYTLEDNGANLSGTSVAQGTAQYAVHSYEVNYIYYRQGNLPYGNEEIAGKMALHYYPAPFLGFELTGVYGQAGGGKKNSLGGRLAADFHKNLGPVGLRASVGAEDRWETLAQTKYNDINPDPAGQPNIKECPECEMRDNKGVGGSGIVTFSIVELGGGLAKGWDLAHKNPSTTVGAERDLAHSGVRTSFGGYLQLDPGKLLFKRSLIIGAGLQHSELVMKTDDYQTHVQGAAYIAFPLGFNDAMVKVVLSRAEAENFIRTSADGAPLTYNKAESAMTAGRVRFAYYF